jgi:hypothetical protein
MSAAFNPAILNAAREKFKQKLDRAANRARPH